MSRESELHMRLVRGAINAIKADYNDVYSLIIYADLPSYGVDRPYAVGGHIPDVLAVDTPETFRVIGEAKTGTDLETDRSKRQIKAFLTHLARTSHSAFYLVVPTFLKARATGLVDDWARSVNASHVRRIVAPARF